ncbi:MAG: head GIN domain-containing protein [Alphaproteobacteria bacterium]
MTKFTTLLMTGAIGAACLYGATAYAHGDDDNHGELTQTFDLKDFDALSVLGVYKLDVEVGSSYSISLSGREKEMNKIKVYAKDGTLYLGKDDGKHKKSNNNKGIDAVITLPSLKALQVTGVATGDISGIKADKFDVSVSGVANVDLDGTCKKLDASFSGVGNVDAEGLKCKSVDVSLNGVGEISVYASDSVDVSANGIGKVEVDGNPKNVNKSKGMLTKVHIK